MMHSFDNTETVDLWTALQDAVSGQWGKGKGGREGGRKGGRLRKVCRNAIQVIFSNLQLGCKH